MTWENRWPHVRSRMADENLKTNGDLYIQNCTGTVIAKLKTHPLFCNDAGHQLATHQAVDCNYGYLRIPKCQWALTKLIVTSICASVADRGSCVRVLVASIRWSRDLHCQSASAPSAARSKSGPKLVELRKFSSC